MGFYSEKIFPTICNFGMSLPELEPHRADVLKTVRGKILEIGFGTGANLRYYPSSIQQITVLEPNLGMNKYSDEAILKRGLKVEKVVGRAEMMPFEQKTFDTVVCTFTLCSVENPEIALHEIERVLKVGGRLLFLEHGLSNLPNIVKWQNRLNGINKAVADGCNINRDIKSLIESSGLRIDSLENFYLPKGPKTHGYLYKGAASRT